MFVLTKFGKPGRHPEVLTRFTKFGQHKHKIWSYGYNDLCYNKHDMIIFYYQSAPTIMMDMIKIQINRMHTGTYVYISKMCATYIPIGIPVMGMIKIQINRVPVHTFTNKNICPAYW